MKTKRLFTLLVCLALLAVAALSFVACSDDNKDGDDPVNPNDKSVLVMEAEYVNLTDPEVEGKAISAEAKGLKLIFGQGYDEGEVKASNGYYLYQTHTEAFEITFKFNSSVATTARISIALGSEKGNVKIGPSEFSVKLNGEAIKYSAVQLQETEDPTAPKFKEATISSNASIKAGENTITLKVETNTLLASNTFGPFIDFAKVRANDSNVELSWMPITSNIEE